MRDHSAFQVLVWNANKGQGDQRGFIRALTGATGQVDRLIYLGALCVLGMLSSVTERSCRLMWSMVPASASSQGRATTWSVNTTRSQALTALFNLESHSLQHGVFRST